MVYLVKLQKLLCILVLTIDSVFPDCTCNGTPTPNKYDGLYLNINKNGSFVKGENLSLCCCTKMNGINFYRNNKHICSTQISFKEKCTHESFGVMLKVNNVQIKDSGNWTCGTHDGESSNLLIVYISESGRKPAVYITTRPTIKVDRNNVSYTNITIRQATTDKGIPMYVIIVIPIVLVIIFVILLVLFVHNYKRKQRSKVKVNSGMTLGRPQRVLVSLHPSIYNRPLPAITEYSPVQTNPDDISESKTIDLYDDSNIFEYVEFPPKPFRETRHKAQCGGHRTKYSDNNCYVNTTIRCNGNNSVRFSRDTMVASGGDSRLQYVHEPVKLTSSSIKQTRGQLEIPIKTELTEGPSKGGKRIRLLYANSEVSNDDMKPYLRPTSNQIIFESKI